MNAPEQTAEAQRWLRFAREDLDAAARLANDRGAVPRHACWLAQQAAEKAIKAALIWRSILFPKQHDLDALAALLPGDLRARMALPDLAELTQWAVEARYPGDAGEATFADAQTAVGDARRVHDGVSAALRP